MMTGIKEIRFEASDPKSYMVVVLEQDAEPSEYCIEMMQRNDISGLMSMYSRFRNGSQELCFDMSGKRRIMDAASSESRSNAVYMMLRSCCRVLLSLDQYFLHPAQCIFDTKYVFS